MMFYASGRRFSYIFSYLIDSVRLSRQCRGEPGGSSLSFASPKESNQRKGDPVRRPFAALRARCGAREKRGHVQTRFAQTSTCPDPLCPVLLTDSPRAGEMQFGSGENPNPNPNPNSYPVLAGLEKGAGDGLKNLDVRRRRSRQVSKFSGSCRFFKEPRSGPDCGSPFLLLTLLLAKQKKSELLPGNSRPTREGRPLSIKKLLAPELIRL